MNYAKIISLTISMVIRRIKDMCGQVISVRYTDKENHYRKRMRLTAKHFCTTIRVWIPKLVESHNPIWIHNVILSAAYSIYKDFHTPLTRLTWLVWNIQVCSVRAKNSLQDQQSDFSDSMKSYHILLLQMGISITREKSKAEQSSQTRYTRR